MITALIRTSNRPELFRRCLESLHWQSYKDWSVIVGIDSSQASEYTRHYPIHVTVDLRSDFELTKKLCGDFFYDIYCETLARYVADNHWFFFLDDDDYLTSPDALANIASYLTDPSRPVICQFLRNGVRKPQRNAIREGKIGLPCLFLHSSHKHLVHCDGYEAGDYRMIKAVTDRLGGYKWAPVVVVEADRRSFGK